MRKTKENEKKERRERREKRKRGIKKNPEYVREYEWKNTRIEYRMCVRVRKYEMRDKENKGRGTGMRETENPRETRRRLRSYDDGISLRSSSISATWRLLSGERLRRSRSHFGSS